jgi:hypothetical protein
VIEYLCQNILQEATKLKKLAKTTARYMEMEEFRDSDLHTGYFCYNCIYFMKPNHCAIVTDEGPDVYDKDTGVYSHMYLQLLNQEITLSKVTQFNIFIQIQNTTILYVE